MENKDKKTGTITKISQKDTFTVKNDIKMRSENGINFSSTQKIQFNSISAPSPLEGWGEDK